MARNVGYTTYEGLPGVLKTGCMNSPEFKARHCSLHRVRACTPYVALDLDEAAPERKESREKVVEMILEKKVTRKATYYKVNLLLSSSQIECSYYPLCLKLWQPFQRITRNFALKTLQVLWVGMEDVCASWVHQKCLSADIIEQYERGVEVDVCVQRQSQGGQATFTASIESKEADTSSAAKKPRTDRWIAPCTSGYTPTTLYITFLHESIH